MKKWIFVVGLILIGVLLVGCGGEETGEGAETAVSPTAVNVSADGSLVGDPAQGKVLFGTICFACHGEDAKGLPGQGKDLTTSEFIRGLSDAEFVAFVKNGRDVTDPLNTTGVVMPPYGGNPALSDQDLFDIVAYIRTLQE